MWGPGDALGVIFEFLWGAKIFSPKILQNHFLVPDLTGKAVQSMLKHGRTYFWRVREKLKNWVKFAQNSLKNGLKIDDFTQLTWWKCFKSVLNGFHAGIT